jgi:hypothetical protein
MTAAPWGELDPDEVPSSHEEAVRMLLEAFPGSRIVSDTRHEGDESC